MEVFRKVFSDTYNFTLPKLAIFNIDNLFTLYAKYYPSDFIYDVLMNNREVELPFYIFSDNGKRISFKHNNHKDIDFVILKPVGFSPITDVHGDLVYLVMAHGSLYQKTFKDIITNIGWKNNRNQYLSFILKLVAAKASRMEIVGLIRVDIPLSKTPASSGIVVVTNDNQSYTLTDEEAGKYPLLLDCIENTKQMDISIPFDSSTFKLSLDVIKASMNDELTNGVSLVFCPSDRIYDCLKIFDYMQIYNIEDYILKCVETVL
jgi:hypothetical protein